MFPLTVQDLCKNYPSFQLKDVSFTVRSGEIMGFIGRNGAGKTTTLKCLLNFVHPDEGQVRFFDMPLEQAEQEIKQRIGFVSGGVDAYTRKKLDDLTAVTKRFYPNWDDGAYQRFIQRFALDGQKTQRQLSAGMRVKYALALAMSHHAELLILDEPTSGLDPVSRDDLLDEFLALAREDVSILFSTHITSDLDKCADGITYIHNGQVHASMPLQDFVGGYRFLTLPDLPESARPYLLGAKPAKTGYTALIRTQDAQRLGLSGEPATLETVMIHLEKEAPHEKSAL